MFRLETRDYLPIPASLSVRRPVLVDKGPLIMVEDRDPFLPRDQVVVAFVGESNDRANEPG